jgi:hypothetical protein
MGWFWWWGKAGERMRRGGDSGEREAQIEEGIRRVNEE